MEKTLKWLRTGNVYELVWPPVYETPPTPPEPRIVGTRVRKFNQLSPEEREKFGLG